MTAGTLLADVIQVLTGQQVTDARAEALRLMAAVLGRAPGSPVVWPDVPVTSAEVDRVRAAAGRRATGAPLAYAVGTAAFRTLELAVDARVLIPRPETEGLVERVLGWQAATGRRGRVADVGTGSGCIALSLAIEGDFEEIVAIDASAEALAVARANAARVGIERVVWQAGDLLAEVPGPFAAIVSNPPYVTAEEWARLDPGVRDHEPRMALVADQDGMALIRRLATEAWTRLDPGGLLAVEVDSGRADAAAEGARAAGFRGARIEDDLYGRPRYLLAIKE